MPVIGECSIMKQISRTEAEIKNCYDRIESLEKKIKSDETTVERKEAMMTELMEIQKLLGTNEEQLSKLHKHNTKSFVVAAALFLIFFALYSLYMLYSN